MCLITYHTVGRMGISNKSIHIDTLFLDFKIVGIMGNQIQRHKGRSIILAKRSCVCDGSLIYVGRVVTWERSLHIDPLFFRLKVCGHLGHPNYKTYRNTNNISLYMVCAMTIISGGKMGI